MLPLHELLAELVRRPSVNPMGRTDLPPEILCESRVTAFLEHELRNIPCEFHRQNVREGRDNLIATYTPPGTVPFSVLFEAHRRCHHAMTIDPFGAKIEEGRLYGRGSWKAVAAVMLARAAVW